MTPMFVKMIFVFSLLLFQCSSDSFFVSDTKCLINYQQNQETFYFQTCILPNQIINLWSQCSKPCCNLTNLAFNKDSLQSCINLSKSASTPNLTVILIVVCVTLAFIFILALLLKRFFNNLSMKKQLQTLVKLNENEKKLITFDLNQPTWIDISLSLAENDTQKVMKQAIFFTFDECSICLIENGEIQTCCGHSFHLKCLSEWFSNKKICPNCRESPQYLKIKCFSCKLKYLIYVFEQSTTYNEKIQLSCKDCLSNNPNKIDIKVQNCVVK